MTTDRCWVAGCDRSGTYPLDPVPAHVCARHRRAILIDPTAAVIFRDPALPSDPVTARCQIAGCDRFAALIFTTGADVRSAVCSLHHTLLFGDDAHPHRFNPDEVRTLAASELLRRITRLERVERAARDWVGHDTPETRRALFDAVGEVKS